MTNLKNRKIHQQGYSLVEMLVVISITLILASLSAVTIPGILSSQTVAQASSDISQTFDDARSYAIANHTYVFVAFEEVNAANQANSANQVQATSLIGGRIAVAIVASKDGSNCSNPTGSPYFNTSNLVAISKLKFFTGVHMSDFSSLTASTGPMATRAPVATANSLGANSTGGSTALFTWPLNASSGNAQYNFYPGQVIVFDDEGLAGVVTSTTYSATYNAPTPTWIELGLQIAHGAAVPAVPTTLSTGQLASIQLDGVTGANRVLRP